MGFSEAMAGFGRNLKFGGMQDVIERCEVCGGRMFGVFGERKDHRECGVDDYGRRFDGNDDDCEVLDEDEMLDDMTDFDEVVE